MWEVLAERSWVHTTVFFLRHWTDAPGAGNDGYTAMDLFSGVCGRLCHQISAFWVIFFTFPCVLELLLMQLSAAEVFPPESSLRRLTLVGLVAADATMGLEISLYGHTFQDGAHSGVAWSVNTYAYCHFYVINCIGPSHFPIGHLSTGLVP